MRTLLLSTTAAVLLLCTPAHADGLLPDKLSFAIGFQQPRELATACVLAIALSGSAREMSSAGVANWCANAALRTFNAFDESVPQPLRRPERRPETINAEKAR